MRKYLASGIALVALLALAALWMRTPASGQETSTLEGKPAPDFTLTSLDGKQVKLSDLKGNVVVVDFWATWCPPCRRSLPHLQSLSTNKQLADQGLKVLAVDCTNPPQETKDKVEAFMKENNFTFPVLLDEGSKAQKAYNVTGIPTTVIVGRDGAIKNVFVGFGDGSAEKMDATITTALKAPKPAK